MSMTPVSELIPALGEAMLALFAWINWPAVIAGICFFALAMYALDKREEAMRLDERLWRQYDQEGKLLQALQAAQEQRDALQALLEGRELQRPWPGEAWEASS